ncbi:MAG: DUF2231 domain-containing protein [Candidatus Binataceae bacterium]
MDAVVNFLTPLDLHPVVDHFTVALLIVGVLIDLVASLFPSRAWMRYMALTLMILGAIAAGSSYATGDMEADRVWKQLGDPAKAVLQRHAMLAQYVAIAFGVLALWRILIEATAAFARTRGMYLIVAIIAAGVLGYVGHLGGVLVYTYGTGTKLMESQPSPSASETPASLPTPSGPLPTVSVPTPLPTEAAPAPSSAPSLSAPAASAKPSSSATALPSASPTASGV